MEGGRGWWLPPVDGGKGVAVMMNDDNRKEEEGKGLQVLFHRHMFAVGVM